jgi:hypothetical protein
MRGFIVGIALAMRSLRPQAVVCHTLTAAFVRRRPSLVVFHNRTIMSVSRSRCRVQSLGNCGPNSPDSVLSSGADVGRQWRTIRIDRRSKRFAIRQVPRKWNPSRQPTPLILQAAEVRHFAAEWRGQSDCLWDDGGLHRRVRTASATHSRPRLARLTQNRRQRTPMPHPASAFHRPGFHGRGPRATLTPLIPLPWTV